MGTGDGYVLLITTLTRLDISEYPERYPCLVFTEDQISHQSQRVFSRFEAVYNLDVFSLVERIVCALQGDEEANGGEPADVSDEEMGYADIGEGDDYEPGAIGIGRGFEIARGGVVDLSRHWGKIKEHFEQGKSMGYRPGITQVSDFYVSDR
jgi:ubiquitin-conjugating enzyme E2 Q